MRRNYANFAEIMAYYLTIDQGNTCVKVDIWDGNSDKIVASRTFDTLQVSDLKMLCNGHKPYAAIYCTVSERDRIIIESLASLTQHAVEMSVDTPMPVRIAYTTPRTLGLDRVAAAIGAYSLCEANRDILVIDIGTAITYDIVSADGIYRGGNIAPGVDMRLRALNHFTARLPLVTIDDTADVPQWGTDTVSALRAGALEGVVGEILHYRNSAGAGAHIVVTGGQAPLILRHLPFQPITHPHLVSLGLYTILRYNFEQ